MKYNSQASAQQIESLQQMGYKVNKDKNKERNPTQVVNINVTAGSAEPGQSVAAAPSVSKNLAQRILSNNSSNYKAGQEIIAVTPEGEQIHFKKVGGGIKEKVKGKKQKGSSNNNYEAKVQDSW